MADSADKKFIKAMHETNQIMKQIADEWFLEDGRAVAGPPSCISYAEVPAPRLVGSYRVDSTIMFEYMRDHRTKTTRADVSPGSIVFEAPEGRLVVPAGRPTRTAHPEGDLVGSGTFPDFYERCGEGETVDLMFHGGEARINDYGLPEGHRKVRVSQKFLLKAKGGEHTVSLFAMDGNRLLLDLRHEGSVQKFLFIDF